MRSSFVITDLFGNTNISDIHEPLPPFKRLNLEDIRELGHNRKKPVCLKYVILGNGELIISNKWSERIPLTEIEIEKYVNAPTPDRLKINGENYPVHSLNNSDMIIFDPKSGKPLCKQFQLKHPEIASNKPVLVAGDAYVQDGKFISKHPSGLYGIDNWTGHYCVSGTAIKDIVESTFAGYGFKEANGCYRDLAAEKLANKTRRTPNIIHDKHFLSLEKEPKPKQKQITYQPGNKKFIAPTEAKITILPQPKNCLVGDFEFPSTIKGQAGVVKLSCSYLVNSNNEIQVISILKNEFVPAKAPGLPSGVAIIKVSNGALIGMNVYNQQKASEALDPDLPCWVHVTRGVGAVAAEFATWHLIGKIAGAGVAIPAGILSVLSALTADPAACFDHARQQSTLHDSNTTSILPIEGVVKNLINYNDPDGFCYGVPPDVIAKMDFSDVVFLNPERMENAGIWKLGDWINQGISWVGNKVLQIGSATTKQTTVPAELVTAQSATKALKDDTEQTTLILKKQQETSKSTKKEHETKNKKVSKKEHETKSSAKEEVDETLATLQYFGPDGRLRNEKGELIDAKGDVIFKNTQKQKNKHPKMAPPHEPLPASDFGYKNLADDVNKLLKNFSMQGGTGKGFEFAIDIKSKEDLMLATAFAAAKTFEEPILNFIGIETTDQKKAKLVKHQCETIRDETLHGIKLTKIAKKLYKRYLEENDPSIKMNLYNEARSATAKAISYNDSIISRDKRRLHGKDMKDRKGHEHATRTNTKLYIADESLPRLVYCNVFLEDQRCRLKILRAVNLYDTHSKKYIEGKIDSPAYDIYMSDYKRRIEEIRITLSTVFRKSELINYCDDKLQNLIIGIQQTRDAKTNFENKKIIQQQLSHLPDSSESKKQHYELPVVESDLKEIIKEDKTPVVPVAGNSIKNDSNKKIEKDKSAQTKTKKTPKRPATDKPLPKIIPADFSNNTHTPLQVEKDAYDKVVDEYQTCQKKVEGAKKIFADSRSEFRVGALQLINYKKNLKVLNSSMQAAFMAYKKLVENPLYAVNQDDIQINWQADIDAVASCSSYDMKYLDYHNEFSNYRDSENTFFQLTSSYQHGTVTDADYEKSCADRMAELKYLQAAAKELCSDPHGVDVLTTELGINSAYLAEELTWLLDKSPKDIFAKHLREVKSILSSDSRTAKEVSALKAAFAIMSTQWSKINNKLISLELMEAKCILAYRAGCYAEAREGGSSLLAIDSAHFVALEVWMNASEYLQTSTLDRLAFLQSYHPNFHDAGEKAILFFYEAKLENNRQKLKVAAKEISAHVNGNEIDTKLYLYQCVTLLDAFDKSRRELLINTAHPDATADVLNIEPRILLLKAQLETASAVNKELEAVDDFIKSHDISIFADLENANKSLQNLKDKKKQLQRQLLLAQEDQKESVVECNRLLGHVQSEKDKKSLLILGQGHLAFDIFYDLFAQRIVSRISADPEGDSAAIKRVANSSFTLASHVLSKRVQQASAVQFTTYMKDVNLAKIPAADKLMLNNALLALEKSGNTNLLAELYSKSELILHLTRLTASIINLAVKKSYDYSAEKTEKKWTFEEWMNDKWYRWLVVQGSELLASIVDLISFGHSCNSLWLTFNQNSIKSLGTAHQAVTTLMNIPALSYFLQGSMNEDLELTTDPVRLFLGCFVDNMSCVIPYYLNTHSDTVSSGLQRIFVDYPQFHSAGNCIRTNSSVSVQAMYWLYGLGSLPKILAMVDLKKAAHRMHNLKRTMRKLTEFMTDAHKQKDAVNFQKQKEIAASILSEIREEAKYFGTMHPERQYVFIQALFMEHYYRGTIEFVELDQLQNPFFASVAEYTKESPIELRKLVEKDIGAGQKITYNIILKLSQTLKRPIILVNDKQGLEFKNQVYATVNDIPHGDPVFVYVCAKTGKISGLRVRGALYFELQLSVKLDAPSPVVTPSPVSTPVVVSSDLLIEHTPAAKLALAKMKITSVSMFKAAKMASAAPIQIKLEHSDKAKAALARIKL